MKKHFFYWLVLCVVIVVGCQKELSFEGNSAPADGSLQADVTGDCLPKTVNGVYEAVKPLVADSNTISVSVNVAIAGSYVITTDTINGYFFRATGLFTTPGINTVKLRGNGTPFVAGTNNFVVTFDSTVCDVQVTVLPAGAGGPAAFTIQGAGSPSNCSGATAAGSYFIGTALNGTNTVTLSVNVTKIGTYSITTTATNGMVFSKAGTFTTLGVQPLVLTGSGTPTGAAGTVTIPITAGGATCSFGVTTVAGAAYTINCPGAMANGTYQAGTALTAANTITLPITVTTAGSYSLSASVNGMTFSNSGSLTLGTTSITLNGTGTPITSTGSPFSLSVGTPACSVPITIVAGATINWKFNIGTTVYQGSTGTSPGDVVYDQTTAAPFSFLDYYGDNPAGDEISISLLDLAGGITNENYNTNSIGFTNGAAFYFNDVAFTIDLTAEPAVPPASAVGNMVFVVTSHNTATKTITGTFSGTAFDSVSNTTKTISSGTFTAVYP